MLPTCEYVMELLSVQLRTNIIQENDSWHLRIDWVKGKGVVQTRTKL